METKEIYKLIETFEASTMTHLEIQQGETTVKLKRETTSKQITVPLENTVQVQPVQTTESVEAAPTLSGTVVPSPLVGIFYASQNPEAPAFVKIGDVVAAGQTLCIVEAMKTMNEIVAQNAGEIVDIHVKNGDLVAFDTPLYTIKEQ